MNYLPEIRNDDVLQLITSTTSAQRKDLDGRTLFEAFVEADQVFEKYQYPCTLAVLSEGIDECPEWVNYIKERQHRFVIQLHGKSHTNYDQFRHLELRLELEEAKNKIEETFGCNITVWYPPWGRKGENKKHGINACKTLKIERFNQTRKVDAKFWLKLYNQVGYSPFPHMNFHYWNRPQVTHVEEVLKICSPLL